MKISGGGVYSADGTTLSLSAGQFSIKAGAAPIIKNAGFVTGQTNAATLATFATGAADGTYRISGSFNGTAALTNGQNFRLTYTDNASNVITTFPAYSTDTTEAGGGVITADNPGQATAEAASTRAFMTPILIRVKASTTITLNCNIANAAGTYDGWGCIEQIA